MPHQSPLSRVIFRPYQPSCVDRLPVAVTSCVDGNFKLWSLSDDTGASSNKISWSCSSVGFYHQKPAGDVAFSEDGSVLAVAFKDVVTLWDPEYNTLHKDVISLGSSEINVRHVVFGRHSCSHLLLFSTDDKLYSWNLLNFSIQCSYKLNVATIAVNAMSDVVAAFTKDAQLVVFSPKSSTYMYKKTNLGTSDVISAQFLPHKSLGRDSGPLCWQNTAHLYFMTKSQELFTLLYTDQLEEECIPNVKLEQNLPRSVLSMLVAEKSNSGVPPSQTVARDNQLTRADSRFLDELLSNPLHGVPPMSMLCMTFIESLLVQKKSSGSGSESEDEDEDKATEAGAAAEVMSSDEESLMDTV